MHDLAEPPSKGHWGRRIRRHLRAKLADPPTGQSALCARANRHAPLCQTPAHRLRAEPGLQPVTLPTHSCGNRIKNAA